MYRWLNGDGSNLRQPRPGMTNYLADYNREGEYRNPEGNRGKTPPFILNQYFKSEPVLDDSMREEVYRRIVDEGKSVRVVSAELGIDMRRVGAVVRLKTIEKDWVKKVPRLFPHPLQSVSPYMMRHTYID